MVLQVSNNHFSAPAGYILVAQPDVWLVMFTLLSSRILRSSLQNCSTAVWPPACTDGFFHPQHRTLHLSLFQHEIPVSPDLQLLKITSLSSTPPSLFLWATTQGLTDFFNLQENTGPVYWCRSQLLGPYSFSVVMNLCSSDVGELQFLCRHSEYSKSWVALSNFFLILLMPTAVGWLSFPWQPSSKMQGWLRDFMILRASHL